MRKIAAWVPVSLEMLRELEPVHVEGGRCEAMAVAYRMRNEERVRAAFRRVWGRPGRVMWP